MTIFLSIPSPSVPVEFEFPSVSMGELTASLLLSVSLLSQEYISSCSASPGSSTGINAYGYFHPQSFSSSSSPSNSSKFHKRTRKIQSVVPLSMVEPSLISPCTHAPLGKSDLKKKYGLWYERDILLRAKYY